MFADLAISGPNLMLKHLQIRSCSQMKVLAISNIKLASLDTTIGHLSLVDLPMLELSISGWFENNISRTLSQDASGLSQLVALSLDAFQLKELTQLSSLAQLRNLKRFVVKVGAWHDQSLTMLVSLMMSCHRLDEFVLANREVLLKMGRYTRTTSVLGCPPADAANYISIKKRSPFTEQVVTGKPTVRTWIQVKKLMKNLVFDEAERHLPEDRISSLSDDILLIILSLLPLKTRVKTSILSSRWLDLWVNIPILDLHAPFSLTYQKDNKKRDEFVKWVSHVLQQRDKDQYLKELRIDCNLDHSYCKDIDTWLEFSLARKIEILELDFLLARCDPWSSLNYALPDCFLKSCGENGSLDGNMSRFLHSGLKCLKSLSLKSVCVTGEAINFILLNCPFLERLEVVDSPKLANLAISGLNLMLKHLQINSLRMELLSVSNMNLVSLDTTVEHLNLVDLPMLVELSVSVSQTLFQHASVLYQIKTLSLHACHLEDLTPFSNLAAQLTNLRRLVIKAGVWIVESLTMLVSLINSCPRLEEFVLELSWSGIIFHEELMRKSNPWHKVERRYPSHEVGRLSSKSQSLKVFELKGYNGRVSDVELVKLVAAHAPGLEKIIIETYEINKHMNKYFDYLTKAADRSMALNKFEALRKYKYLPAHIDVIIR